MTQDNVIANELRKVGRCIYLAVDSSIADDIAEKVNKAAAHIDTLTKKVAQQKLDLSGKTYDGRVFELEQQVESQKEEIKNLKSECTECRAGHQSFMESQKEEIRKFKLKAIDAEIKATGLGIKLGDVEEQTARDCADIADKWHIDGHTVANKIRTKYQLPKEE